MFEEFMIGESISFAIGYTRFCGYNLLLSGQDARFSRSDWSHLTMLVTYLFDVVRNFEGNWVVN